ncbi:MULTISPECIES: type IV pilus inner membrane component PilO [Oceanospirillaceae]|jgi:type IV pilus assembly protein PilO|uniref:type 4a pilus biogenesis protein PilO n=1 Tax=Oceanospirillaceae TaxID=135620 RepID=UPI0011970CEF|nr:MULTISPECIES: type 4a pilus biogenesis protein PilO [Thalassolituus]MCB2386287.1 type 4a pilus biogenesis protein PilO [Thalassolituus alkanivorans]MCB2424282.1 type 4a pilus biogenesis protein PilO [Thalassolituus alkanivorans]TVV41880.1 pilus assembly protein PilP [Thalassolituus sp. C2-1]
MADLKKIDLKALTEKLNEFQLDDLNNIDWENMGSWPFPGKVVFCVLIFIAVLVGGYFGIVEENLDRLSREVKKEATLKKDYENKAFSVANLAAYKSQMVEMEESFGSLLKQLPRDTEVPGLIDDISSAALSAGLKLNAIDPQKMTKTEFYNELPIDIEVVGGYHEMGAFVSSVASLPRIVTLHDFSIEKSGKDGALKMKILAKTYQYSSDEGGK